MKYLPLLLVIVFSCFYNANAPDPSLINDVRPRLALSLSGFTPGSRVYLRYWDGSTPYTYPSSYTLFTDTAGNFQNEIILNQGTSTAAILVYVDENQNGTLDTSDFGVYQSSIAINNLNLYTYVNITYSAGTLTTPYTVLAPLPSSGIDLCVYMPPGTTSYSLNMNLKLPAYPSFNGTSLVTSDWFPITILSTTGIVQQAPLPASWAASINEVCVPQ